MLISSGTGLIINPTDFGSALRLASYFGRTGKLRVGLQDDYDLEKERKGKQGILKTIRKNAPQNTA
jgi:plasmid maintenance system antidote protein VapI